MRPFLNIILIFVSLSVCSQPIFFNRSYLAPETYWTWGKSVVQTDLGYLSCAIGSGYDGWPNKNVILCFTDEEGTPYQWKHYGETTFHYYPAGYGSLTHINGKGYALPVNLEQGDFIPSELYMFDYNGDTLWTRSIIDEETGDSSNIILRNLIEGSNKDLILCGTIIGKTNVFGDFFIMRTNSQGINKRQNYFGSTADEEIWSIAETPDNGLLLGGRIIVPGLDYSGDAVVTKVDYWGEIEWQRIYGGNFKDAIATVSIAHDDNYLVGYGHGCYEPTPGYVYSVLTFLKINQGGDTIWCHQFGDTLLWNSVDKIIPLEDGNYMAMGTTQIEPNVLSRSYLFKFNDNGDSLWYYQYLFEPVVPGNLIGDFCQTRDMGFIMCGGINTEIPPNSQQMWMIKVDSNGCDTCGTGVGIIQYTNSSGIFLDVFPNPTTSQIQVRFSLLDPSASEAFAKEARSSIFIYDLYGRKQEEINIPEGQEQTKIDVSAYPSGIYIAVLKDEKGIVARSKFIKR